MQQHVLHLLNNYLLLEVIAIFAVATTGLIVVLSGRCDRLASGLSFLVMLGLSHDGNAAAMTKLQQSVEVELHCTVRIEVLRVRDLTKHLSDLLRFNQCLDAV